MRERERVPVQYMHKVVFVCALRKKNVAHSIWHTLVDLRATDKDRQGQEWSRPTSNDTDSDHIILISSSFPHFITFFFFASYLFSSTHPYLTILARSFAHFAHISTTRSSLNTPRHKSNINGDSKETQGADRWRRTRRSRPWHSSRTSSNSI